MLAKARAPGKRQAVSPLSFFLVWDTRPGRKGAGEVRHPHNSDHRPTSCKYELYNARAKARGLAHSPGVGGEPAV